MGWRAERYKISLNSQQNFAFDFIPPLISFNHIVTPYLSSKKHLLFFKEGRLLLQERKCSLHRNFCVAYGCILSVMNTPLNRVGAHLLNASIHCL